MILQKTKNYRKQSNSLPKKNLALLRKQEILLAENISHPKLHTKRLRGLPDTKVFSFRITRIYRGIFRVSGENVILFAIGHRRDIYQSLK
jgi:mRNA-degrading endonuclease RelE of RelBE toxin-antitoxin system